MKNTGRIRNYNQSGDLTNLKKIDFIRKHIPAVEFVKIIEFATGIFSHFNNESVTELDGRKPGRTSYSIQVIMIVCLLVTCLGISVIHDLQAASIYPALIDNIAHLTGIELVRIPDYMTINNALSKITDLSWFEALAQDIFEKLRRSGRYTRDERYSCTQKQWKLHGVRVILDGTDYAFFRTPHCIYDLKATFKKGTPEEKTLYFHKALVAYAVLAPHFLIPIAVEFIKNKDGDSTSKQDCENAAALRVMERIRKRFPKIHFIMCGDALYANKTFISKCRAYHWNYLFTLKKGVQPTLYQEFQAMKGNALLQSARVKYGTEEGTLYWAEDMGQIIESDLPMHILEYTTSMTIRKGKNRRRAGGMTLRQKDFKMDMPEMSRDHDKFDLDEKRSCKKDTKARKEAEKEEAASEKAKQSVEKINEEQAAELQDATVYTSSEDLQEGDVIQVRFMYITDIRPTVKNVCALLVYGRDRWTIEENFRNAKLGPLKMEHLRSLDSNAMEVYFWIEQIAAVLVHLYIYHSGILKIAGSQKEVYEILRNSFESQCLEDHAEELSASKRICLWNRDPEHHCFPSAKIIEMNPPRKEGKGKASGQPKSQKGGNRKSSSKKAAAKGTGKTAVKESGKKPAEKPEKTTDGSEEVKKDYTAPATVREKTAEGEYSKVTDIRYSPGFSTSDKEPSAAVYKVQGKSELPHKPDPKKLHSAKSGGRSALRTGSGHGEETDKEPLDGKGIREGDSEQRVPA